MRGPGGGKNFSKRRRYGVNYASLASIALRTPARDAMDGGATNHSQETVDEVAPGVGASLRTRVTGIRRAAEFLPPPFSAAFCLQPEGLLKIGY